MIWLRRVFMCWWGGCGGQIDHDKHSVFWRCAHCGKMDRMPAIGKHWEPLDDDGT